MNKNLSTEFMYFFYFDLTRIQTVLKQIKGVNALTAREKLVRNLNCLSFIYLTFGVWGCCFKDEFGVTPRTDNWIQKRSTLPPGPWSPVLRRFNVHTRLQKKYLIVLYEMEPPVTATVGKVTYSSGSIVWLAGHGIYGWSPDLAISVQKMGIFCFEVDIWLA